eukprot:15367129-Ditylum_brightwellii.AAC.1
MQSTVQENSSQLPGTNSGFAHGAWASVADGLVCWVAVRGKGAGVGGHCCVRVGFWLELVLPPVFLWGSAMVDASAGVGLTWGN